ncbi:MAG: glycosyltransferase family 39 protein [Acidobacteria bacterium]|nr:glycosyltransferase family 39 protein [Acidobacteriota bacterium]
MARAGDWMTPKLLGRYFLEKPPLLAWLSGLSIKCFGVSLLALRLPVLLAGSLAATLVFLWLWETRSAVAALAGAMLLVSNRLWHTYSRLCMTDALLGTWVAAAIYCWARDPTLARRATFMAFCFFAAAAVMTKSIAGLAPLLALLVYRGLMRGRPRPSWKRVGQACLFVACFALPWHFYQLVVHPRWFWAEYVKRQIFSVGLNPPQLLSPEVPPWFYLKRLVLTDPVLCALVVLAAPSLWTALRAKKSSRDVVLVSWILTAVAVLMLFRSRNLPYLCLLLPALCIVVAGHSPWRSKGSGMLATAALCGLFFTKASFSAQPWGLPFFGEGQVESAPALRAYCEKGRLNELILVSPDDDFYSAVLPIPRVHYCFIDPVSSIDAYGRHFPYLGITVTADQFNRLDRWEGLFRERLLAWGLNSTQPVATAIVAASESDVLGIIQAHPESDFFLPAQMRSAAEGQAKSTHEAVPGTSGRFFLLALRSPQQRNASLQTPVPRYW